jgi:hypothetical protein
VGGIAALIALDIALLLLAAFGLLRGLAESDGGEGWNSLMVGSLIASLVLVLALFVLTVAALRRFANRNVKPS